MTSVGLELHPHDLSVVACDYILEGIVLVGGVLDGSND